jgi:hypothetical protein
MEMLLRLRVGRCNEADLTILRSRFAKIPQVSEVEIVLFKQHAISLAYRRASALDANIQKLCELGNPQVCCNAIHTGNNASKATDSFAGAPSTILLSVGAKS